MKRIIFTLVCSLLTIGLWAVETTDYIKLSTATVVPGGDEVKLTVSLVGTTNYYTAYNMDIHLPEGMSVTYKNNKPRVAISASSRTASAFYPSTEEEEEEETVYKYTHSVTCSYGVVGDRVLRVACYSNYNEAFKAVSGDLFTFYIKASAYTKPGVAQITIDGVALKVAGGSEYDPANRVDENVIVDTSSSTTLNILSTNKWSTCILPFDAEIPIGVNAYKCVSKDEDASVLKLTEAETLTAYTPYVLYSEIGYAGSLSGNVDGSKYPASGYVTDGLLNGAIETMSVSTGYILQNLSEGVKFYSCNGNVFSIPAGKCWVTNSSSARSLKFEIDDATGIKETDFAPTLFTNEGAYNLQGMLVDGNYKGIIIKGGKKFIYK